MRKKWREVKKLSELNDKDFKCLLSNARVNHRESQEEGINYLYVPAWLLVPSSSPIFLPVMNSERVAKVSVASFVHFPPSIPNDGKLDVGIEVFNRTGRRILW